VRQLQSPRAWFEQSNKAIHSFLLWACCVLHVAAQEPAPRAPDAPQPAAMVVEPFGARFAAAVPAPLQQARVFVYRPGPVAKSEPVNIYLNGRYHTSLLRGGYTEFCALPGSVAFHAVHADAQKMHTGRQEPAQSWSFQPGKTLFLKVQEPGRLTEVATDQAQRELPGSALQIHTVSRATVVQDCQEPAPVLAQAPAVKAVAPKPPVPRLYALESDALFEFGKSELRASSYNTIEIMAQKLKQDFSSVERIRVVGHSDAIGPVKLNIKLSMERAKVVAQQLQERGLRPLRGFKVEGEGATHLVKLRCGNTPTPENKLCHAPNRRVEIVVTGARR
jgi:OmpA-OmpF porin, OOP family